MYGSKSNTPALTHYNQHAVKYSTSNANTPTCIVMIRFKVRTITKIIQIVVVTGEELENRTPNIKRKNKVPSPRTNCL